MTAVIRRADVIKILPSPAKFCILAHISVFGLLSAEVVELADTPS